MNSAMIWPLISDIVVAGLLVATIYYVVRLNSRLAVMRDDRDSLRDLISGLQLATGQAEEGVRGLKLSTAESGRELHDTVVRATGLREDLVFLVEKAEQTADRLESLVRPTEKAPAPAEPAVEPPDPRPTKNRLAALLRQAVAAEEDTIRTEPKPGRRLRESVRATGSSHGVQPAETGWTTEPIRSAPSRSERELQQALLERR